MTTFSPTVLRLATASSLFLFSAVSAAHVDLQQPTPRLAGQANDPQLKTGPCGQTANGRTANVNVYTPGETITVRWNEYIDHPSYYRIAFDDDGDNGFEMRTDGQTNAAADNPVAMENALGMDAEILSIVPEVNDTTTGAGTDVREVQVTLPNITCENCTLQLIQYMYNNPMQGYYQCADIALRGTVAAGGDADAGTDPVPAAADAGAVAPEGAGGSLGTVPAPGDSSGNGTGGASGAPTGVAAPGAGGTAITGAAGSQSAGTGGGAAATAGDDDDGGCSLPASGSSSNRSGLFAVLALGLALLRRRS